MRLATTRRACHLQTIMTRFVRLALPTALLAGLTAGPLAGAARAQAPQGPTVPLALDLTKVPTGTWSEYQITVGELPPMKQRFALVDRQGKTHGVEMKMEGGMAAAVGPVWLRIDLDPTEPTERIKKVIMQMGASDPMEMPTNAAPAGQQPFRSLNPKTLVKTETVKVPAGTFKTKLYRDALPDGSVAEYWVSADAPPFGVVKARANLKSGGPAGVGGQMTMALAARGTDAKPNVPKTARPFDQAALMKQLMNAAGKGGAGAGAPPPAAPAPAPTK